MADDIKTRPLTPEYADGYDRTFGKDRRPVRGRWVWDEAQQKLVSADEYRAPPQELAIHSGIMVYRFYENTKAIDGTDIGSRRKHRAYMKERGLAPADDFSPRYYEGIQKQREAEAKKARRETLERALYKIDKP